MRISVNSEVGPLRSVAVHTPSAEITRMTQHELDKLLFDDILSPKEAVREHRILVEILEGAGAQAHQIKDLLFRALKNAPEEESRRLLHRVCELGGATALADVLMEWPHERVAEGLISGIDWRDIQEQFITLARIREQLQPRPSMALSPVPNLMFMRDPCISIYDRVVMGRMATGARAREALLVAFALKWADSNSESAPLFSEHSRGPDRSIYSLEGGDVLVLSPQVLMIGCSQRTSAQTIEHLCQGELFLQQSQLERVYVVMMPEARSIMHLDTILTQIDRSHFLGHYPLIASQSALPIVRLQRSSSPQLLKNANALDVLKEEFGASTQLVPCGGDDPLYQEREQWTDGANAICLSPGKIILYGRNVHTIEALKAHDFEEVKVAAVLPKSHRAALITEGMKKPRTVFSFSGSELSRARGGGRCLTMPLERAPL